MDIGMMENNDIVTLRNNIEEMDHVHQLRILEIVNKETTNYTENSNGIFINMTVLSKKTISDIANYIKYVILQQQQLDKIENDKESLKNTYYKDKEHPHKDKEHQHITSNE